MTIRLFLSVFALLLPWPAFAGGVSWQVTVEEFREVSNEEVVVLLRFSNPPREFPESCFVLNVTIRLEPEPFWRGRTWSRDQVTPTTHAEALDTLRRAAVSHEPIRFGSMGNGLAPTGPDPCSRRSKGLAVLKEHSGARAVYSFHNPV